MAPGVLHEIILSFGAVIININFKCANPEKPPLSALPSLRVQAGDLDLVAILHQKDVEIGGVTNFQSLMRGKIVANFLEVCTIEGSVVGYIKGIPTRSSKPTMFSKPTAFKTQRPSLRSSSHSFPFELKSFALPMSALSFLTSTDIGIDMLRSSVEFCDGDDFKNFLLCRKTHSAYNVDDCSCIFNMWSFLSNAEMFTSMHLHRKYIDIFNQLAVFTDVQYKFMTQAISHLDFFEGCAGDFESVYDKYMGSNFLQTIWRSILSIYDNLRRGCKYEQNSRFVKASNEDHCICLSRNVLQDPFFPLCFLIAHSSSIVANQHMKLTQEKNIDATTEPRIIEQYQEKILSETGECCSATNGSNNKERECKNRKPKKKSAKKLQVIQAIAEVSAHQDK